MKLRSIDFRLAVWYGGLLAGLFLLVAVIAEASLTSYVSTSITEGITKRARETAHFISARSAEFGPTYSHDIDMRFIPEGDNGFMRISRSSDGAVLYVSRPPKDQSFTPDEIPAAEVSDQQRADRKENLRDGGRLYISSFHINASDATPLLLEIGSSDRHLTEVLNQLRWILLPVFPVAVIIAIAGGYFLTKRALRPIRLITATAESITSRNLSERLPVPHTGDEVELLSSALNRMIERLENAFRYLDRFTADASHELRTPLTILRGELEALLRSTDVPPEVRDVLGSSLEEIDRLSTITENLLVLSQFESGRGPIDAITIDVRELARSTGEQMRILASDKGVLFESDIDGSLDGPLVVYGNEMLLRQALVNLLDNAIKYTPPGGSVSLSTRAADGMAVIDVRDTGRGIGKEALHHIFERFYREDRGRERATGGIGLGLSIVKSICDAHDAKVVAESSPNTGTRISVQLPRHMSTNDQIALPPGKS